MVRWHLVRGAAHESWFICACVLLVVLASGSANAQQCSVGPRVPFAGHALPLSGETTASSLGIIRVYPNVVLDQPLQLVSPPDGTGRLFVVEKTGRIRILPADPSGASATVFLDLSASIVSADAQGLLGLVFDPAYATNRRFYVDYIAPGRDCRSTTPCMKLARFLARSGNPNQADPVSKVELLEITRDETVHNGGMLAFGPDGMLYASEGDDGGAQDLSKLTGKLLRIDVRGSTYAIPADNPFRGQTGRRGEIWAYGLRNPWRFSFDKLTGDLWIGDVGQTSWEEVDYLPAGSPGGVNFGWPFCEGTHDGIAGTCASIQSRPPLLEYSHDPAGGLSVTGGYVYRGSRLPSLYGSYLYADWAYAKLWARPTPAQPSVVVANPSMIVSFGEANDGELYLVAISGELYQLGEAAGGSVHPFPTLLSQTGLFANVATLTPALGLVEYGVNSPLWSDGARKRRWIALPGTQQIGFSASGDWSFPVGTAFVKHFELPVTPSTTRRVETRVLLRQVDRWVGYTYRWNAAQTDATLLTDAASDTFTVDTGGGSKQQTWQYPSPAQCLGCHTNAAGIVLGVRTPQLNRRFDYAQGSDQQLHAWGGCLGLFNQTLGDPAGYPVWVDPADTTHSLAERSRSYLAANCSHCHRPGGPGPGGMDMRAATPLEEMNLIGVAPEFGDLGIAGAQRIHSGSRAQSVLWQRVQSTDHAVRMPKESNLPDPLAVSLLGAWIDSAPESTCSTCGENLALTGTAHLKLKKVANVRAPASVSVALEESTWTGVGDAAPPLAGSISANRKRTSLTASLDAASLSALRSWLEAALEAESGADVSLDSLDEFPIKLKLNKARTKAALKLKVKLFVTVNGVLRKGVYKIALKGPVSAGGK